MCDEAENLLLKDENQKYKSILFFKVVENVERILIQEEYLPFKPNSMDLCISSYGLHWINDIYDHIDQILKILKDDGLFIGILLFKYLIGAIIGGDSLNEVNLIFKKVKKFLFIS
jgi:NADH dehydrogenase [ubiquinone] 1 alpha subcomplex assembly factor 5